jgi:TRAP-type mannitol/chloroaromatic compound transport system permease small subunit
MQRFAKAVSGLNEWLGKAVSFLIIGIMGVVCFEVAARYFFNRPSLWAEPFATYLLCICSLLGGGFTLLRGAHVNVDIVYGRFSTRTRAVLACATSVLAFIFLGVLIWKGWVMFRASFVLNELAGSVQRWPLFPFKLMVPLGAALLLLQCLAKLTTDLLTAITGKPPEGAPAPGVFGRSKEE